MNITRISYFNRLRAEIIEALNRLRMKDDVGPIRAKLEELARIER